MTCDKLWNTRTVKFPHQSEQELVEIETQNISKLILDKDTDYLQNRLTRGTKRIISQSSQVISDFDISYQVKEYVYDATVSVRSNDKDVYTILDYDIINQKYMRPRNSFSSTARCFTITHEDLSERSRISYEQAEMILKMTTRKLKRSAIYPYQEDIELIICMVCDASIAPYHMIWTPELCHLMAIDTLKFLLPSFSL